MRLNKLYVVLQFLDNYCIFFVTQYLFFVPRCSLYVTRYSYFVTRYSHIWTRFVLFCNTMVAFCSSKLIDCNPLLDYFASKLDFFNSILDFSNSTLDFSNWKLEFLIWYSTIQQFVLLYFTSSTVYFLIKPGQINAHDTKNMQILHLMYWITSTWSKTNVFIILWSCNAEHIMFKLYFLIQWISNNVVTCISLTAHITTVANYYEHSIRLSWKNYICLSCIKASNIL